MSEEREASTVTEGHPGLPGASLWEKRLFAHLTGHVEHERALLGEYAEAARSTDSKALAYLIDLLISDEQHHHRLFRQLADSLQSSAELRLEEPSVPWIDFGGRHADEAIDVTRRLLKYEESDARELRRLQGDLREVKDTTLWSLLVALMQRDTEKHIAILRFVIDHAGAT